MTSLSFNIAASGIQTQLKQHASDLSLSLERLSSGLRINRAADDPAGLQLANSLTSQARVLTKAVQNINDGISLANVVEAALGELQHILARQEELAEQAANEALSASQRQALNEESEALVDEYNRIVASTEYNDIGLLDLTRTEVSIMAGSSAGDGIDIALAEELARITGDGTFGSRATFGAPVYSATTGDMNGDGITDIISGRWQAVGLAVDVLLGNGDGTFKAAMSFYNGGSSLGIGVADVDGDGDLDLVSPSQAEGKVNIFLGNGNGTLEARKSFYVGVIANGASLLDLDDDGDTDILAMDGSSRTYNLLFNNGNGTFAARISYGTGASFSYGSLMADVNNDGDQDLLTSAMDGKVYSYLGNGNATFAAGVSSSFGGTSSWNYPQEISVGDLNHDGYLDVVQTLDQNSALAVLFGCGNGTFGSPTSYGLGFMPRAATIEDMNGDGRLDILTVGVSNSLRVLLNRGDGTFSYGQSLGASSTVNAVIAEDFNGDGVVDIFGGGENDANIFIGKQQRLTTMAYLNLGSATSATEAQTTIEEMQDKVAAQFALTAAVQSRLGHAVSYAQVARENMSAAANQITSLDVAEEVARMTSAQILVGASQAMLAQANQQGSIVMQLIDSL